MPSSSRSSQPRDRTRVILCLLHWQMVSLPPVPPGKPYKVSMFKPISTAQSCLTTQGMIEVMKLGIFKIHDWERGRQQNHYPSMSRILFIYLAAPCGMQNHSSLTRDQTQAPCGGLPGKFPSRVLKSAKPLVYSSGPYGPEPNQSVVQSRHSLRKYTNSLGVHCQLANTQNKTKNSDER